MMMMLTHSFFYCFVCWSWKLPLFIRQLNNMNFCISMTKSVCIKEVYAYSAERFVLMLRIILRQAFILYDLQLQI